uniref:Syntaxin N-terminal domain-containing protein n=1 Tax=Ditylenchus dipsaci TaxID=166011 RepID=A0A915DPH3_9BILA
MSDHMKNEETGAAGRLEKVEEAITNLGNEVKVIKEHLQRVDESIQKSMSVAGVQKDVKSELSSSMAQLETMKIRKRIRLLFTQHDFLSSRHLESPVEEFGGAK